MAELHSEYGWGHFPAPSTKLNPQQFAPHIYYEADPKRDTSNFGYKVAGVKMYSDEKMNHDNQIGEMTWNKERGEILDIRVPKGVRRKGVATAMYKAAKDVAKRTGVAEPVHSADRSDLGQKWAKSTGEPLPKRLKSSNFPT